MVNRRLDFRRLEPNLRVVNDNIYVSKIINIIKRVGWSSCGQWMMSRHYSSAETWKSSTADVPSSSTLPPNIERLPYFIRMFGMHNSACIVWYVILLRETVNVSNMTSHSYQSISHIYLIIATFLVVTPLTMGFVTPFTKSHDWTASRRCISRNHFMRPLRPDTRRKAILGPDGKEIDVRRHREAYSYPEYWEKFYAGWEVVEGALTLHKSIFYSQKLQKQAATLRWNATFCIMCVCMWPSLSAAWAWWPFNLVVIAEHRPA